MSARTLGLIIGASEIVAVDAGFQKGHHTIHADETWEIPEGDRCQAYAAFHARLVDYITRQGITRVLIKASAVGPGKASLSLLRAAELRGVGQAAAASTGIPTIARDQAAVRRGLGKQKTEDYLADEAFWKEQPITGKLRKGSRLAMLFILGEPS
jgi:hypothetical protein